MTEPFGREIESLNCQSNVIPESIFGTNKPVVLRGLAADWPIVEHGRESANAAVDYLLSFYNKQPVRAFLAEPEVAGRIFYNQDVDGFNFVQTEVYLDDALNKVLNIAGGDNNPTYYLGSLEIPETLPGFLADNDLPLDYEKVRKSIWLGNQSQIAPHFDFPDNIACCVIGHRRFTLFPPEQLQNLYVGPIDLTPGGQQISMVDLNAPDLEKFPKFNEAIEAAVFADLAPGDAIYIPSMWWHNVESLSPVNGLVNFWWRDTPDYLGVPNNVLLHAMMSLRSLPERQRNAWKNLFDHYVFDQPEGLYDHLPEGAKNRLSNMNENTARKIRTQLVNKLK